MKLDAQYFFNIFYKNVETYHIKDKIDYNPDFKLKDKFEELLLVKNWIDIVQWHLEDMVRDPNINPSEGLKIKHKIDKSNQERTNKVEIIDKKIFDHFIDVKIKKNAKYRTESIGWAIDRLSILSLKIYHMKIETTRQDVKLEHINLCIKKVDILNQQKNNLQSAIDDLIEDTKKGLIKPQIYLQMKMYNDQNLNPILYKNKK